MYLFFYTKAVAFKLLFVHDGECGKAVHGIQSLVDASEWGTEWGICHSPTSYYIEHLEECSTPDLDKFFCPFLQSLCFGNIWSDKTGKVYQFLS